MIRIAAHSGPLTSLPPLPRIPMPITADNKDRPLVLIVDDDEEVRSALHTENSCCRWESTHAALHQRGNCCMPILQTAPVA
jgi:hypothetical protein